MISPQYVADLVSWGAIGARTTESQVHRQLASGLSCPVGFKNGTSGNVQIAIEAILSASHPHTFLGTTDTGQSAILLTSGNPDCHVILRGGRQITNYDSASVTSTAEQMEKAGVQSRIMIDCSHANSGKDHRRQGAVCRSVSEQIAGGEESHHRGNDRKQSRCRGANARKRQSPGSMAKASPTPASTGPRRKRFCVNSQTPRSKDEPNLL